MKGKTKRYGMVIKLLFIAIIILMVYSLFLSYAYLNYKTSSSNSVQVNNSAEIIFPEYQGSIYKLKISLYSNQKYASTNIILAPASYYNTSYTNNSFQSNVIVYNSTKNSTTYGNFAYLIFGGLKPYTTYHLTVFGTEQPYCNAKEICPMYIRAISEKINFTTGAPGTTSYERIQI